MTRIGPLLFVVSSLLFGSTASLGSQEPADTAAAGGEALQVFVDCRAPFCDLDHFRREIGFVNWMREREDAQVHVLVTAQQTGGGGWELTLAFIGRRNFEGRPDTLRYTSSNTDTSAEVRDGLMRTLELGLVRYAARTPVARRLRVRYEAPAGGAAAAAAQPEDDPWNFWTFRTHVGGSVNGERSQRGISLNGSISASRTTLPLKITFSIFGDYERDEFELNDTTTFVNRRENFSARFLTVQSLGPHWSAGVRVQSNRSTFINRDFGIQGGPAIEFNVFPYDESTRKQLTILYTAGPAVFDYEKETIYRKTSETLAQHSLEVSVSVQQPWGSVFGRVAGTQFLHDLGVHRIDTFGGFNLRVFRGLEFNMFGNVSRIKDQIYLPGEGLSEEEILVRRRQRETDFRFRANVGLSYRFGSKFANVVNPRMDGGGGFFFFF